jgi:hypothetical protein
VVPRVEVRVPYVVGGGGILATSGFRGGEGVLVARWRWRCLDGGWGVGKKAGWRGGGDAALTTGGGRWVARGGGETEGVSKLKMQAWPEDGR